MTFQRGQRVPSGLSMLSPTDQSTEEVLFHQQLGARPSDPVVDVQPPPNDPNFTPVWGNVHDTHIQIDPFKLFLLGHLPGFANHAPPRAVRSAGPDTAGRSPKAQGVEHSRTPDAL